jgi:hypothetical protein
MAITVTGREAMLSGIFKTNKQEIQHFTHPTLEGPRVLKSAIVEHRRKTRARSWHFPKTKSKTIMSKLALDDQIDQVPKKYRIYELICL